MGIFSLFGKKDRQPTPTPAPAEKPSSRKNRGEGSAREESASEVGRAQIAQRTMARATAMKIDKIESEMSSEFVKPSNSEQNAPNTIAAKNTEGKPPLEFQSTLPAAQSTTIMLGGDSLLGKAAPASTSEAAPAMEEAAILFANGQSEMAEQVLQNAIHEVNLGAEELTVWAMLFDLYQLTGKREPFDSLSIEYASKFETSPPSWMEISQAPQEIPVVATKATPTVPFSGKLDGNIVKLLERAQKLAEQSKVLRLEFNRVTEVDPVGCGILFNVLKKLQKSDHELILVGALELSSKVRSILEVGRRDETEAPWMLLMEILRLLNLEKDFEEASIDYCVTFEVSPPAFVAPKNKVTTALEDDLGPKEETEYFMMPAVIEGRTDQLTLAIADYAAEHNPAILDCSRLTRVDFGATGQLLSGLAPLTGNGLVIELHNVNQLITALFNVMGLKDIVRILPRKN